MIFYFIISGLAGIFAPNDAVLINQVLQGYWLVLEDHSDMKCKSDEIKVLRFNMCNSEAKKNKHCEYGWSYLDRNLLSKNKLEKSVKENWNPSRSSVYWVGKKKNKSTKRVVLHMINKSEISLKLKNKELTIYQENKLIYRLTKLK